jgi:hypothetical protein
MVNSRLYNTGVACVAFVKYDANYDVDVLFFLFKVGVVAVMKRLDVTAQDTLENAKFVLPFFDFDPSLVEGCEQEFLDTE